MSEQTETLEQDSFWVTTLLSYCTTRIGYLAIALLIGHRSFTLPDFGITPWHIFTLAILGACAIWVDMLVTGRRANNRIHRGLRANGFTEDQIIELDAEYRKAARWGA